MNVQKYEKEIVVVSAVIIIDVIGAIILHLSHVTYGVSAGFAVGVGLSAIAIYGIMTYWPAPKKKKP